MVCISTYAGSNVDAPMSMLTVYKIMQLRGMRVRNLNGL